MYYAGCGTFSYFDKKTFLVAKNVKLLPEKVKTYGRRTLMSVCLIIKKSPDIAIRALF